MYAKITQLYEPSNIKRCLYLKNLKTACKNLKLNSMIFIWKIYERNFTEDEIRDYFFKEFILLYGSKAQENIVFILQKFFAKK